MTTAPFEPDPDLIPGSPDIDQPNPIAPGEQPDETPPEPQPTES